MDTEHLIDRIQILLLEFETRQGKRISELEASTQKGFAAIDVRLDSIDRKLTLQAGVLSHMVQWSDRVEDEVIKLSAELADVKERLGKLENPAA